MMFIYFSNILANKIHLITSVIKVWKFFFSFFESSKMENNSIVDTVEDLSSKPLVPPDAVQGGS